MMTHSFLSDTAKAAWVLKRRLMDEGSRLVPPINSGAPGVLVVHFQFHATSHSPRHGCQALHKENSCMEMFLP
jgi:hypothetical protein